MNDLAGIIRQQRVAMGLTLKDLASTSGISQSHLGRIERGERFPSASVLRRFAKPLGFNESELFTLAGFLSPGPVQDAEQTVVRGVPGLDPYVAQLLAREPAEIQRTVIGIFTILKSIAKGIAKEEQA